MLSKIKEFIDFANNKRLVGIMAFLLIIAALPLTIIIAQQQQEIRQRAAELMPLVLSEEEVSKIISQNEQRLENLDIKDSVSNLPELCPSVSLQHEIQKPNPKRAEELISILSELTPGLSNAIRAYPSAKGRQKDQLENQIKKLSIHRKPLIIELMKENPDTALKYVISFSFAPPNCVETQTTVEGTLEILHLDFFDENKSSTYYTLVTQNNQRVSLHITHPNKALISGMKLKVKGYLLDNNMLIDANNPESLSILSVSRQPSSGFLVKQTYAEVPDAKGVQQTAVLMVNFQNTTQPALTQAQVNDVVFNQVNNYYKETSYDQTSFEGSVHGWYTIPIDQTCDFLQTATEAIKAADADLDYTQFGRLLIIAPFGPSCGWGGISTLGKVIVSTPDGDVSMSESWVTHSGVSLSTTGHEIGHGLGVGHANFLDCGAVSVSDTGCSVDEYGDYYDIMGDSSAQWNAPHKDYIGWFSPSNIQTITANGTYTLEPFETITSGLKAIKIQRAPSDYLYVEYRQPIGADANITIRLPPSDVFNGALIHTTGRTPDESYLIDATPPGDNLTTVIPVGSTFMDPASKATLSVTSKTESALTVDVSVCKTDFTAPTVSSIANLFDGKVVSGTITLTVDASDASGIQKVEFWQYEPSLLLGTVTSPPYTISVDTTRILNGDNFFRAIAYDNSGIACDASSNVTNTSWVYLIVSNTDSVPPTVSITSPADGSVFSRPSVIITIEATASDDVGVYKVEFWKDTDTLPSSTALTAPYIGSIYLSSGIHTITAKAYDFVGNVTSSQPVTISVNPPTPTPTRSPTLTLTPTPTPTPYFCTPCKADINKDGIVDSRDSSLQKTCLNKKASQSIGTTSCAQSDLNRDGIIDIVDTICISKNSGIECPLNQKL